MYRIHSDNFIPNVIIDDQLKTITVYSHFIVYGDEADEMSAEMCAANILTFWGAHPWQVWLHNDSYTLLFESTAVYNPTVTESEIQRNLNLRNVYIRIEEKSPVHVSYADGLGSNSGYFIVHNITQIDSNTISHEYGHMMGLWPGNPTGHPLDLDQRGNGMPGIMYPRGTLVDAQYQYDPNAKPGEVGGTIDPKNRRVNEKDIAMLMSILKVLDKSHAQLGKLSNRYHKKYE